MTPMVHMIACVAVVMVAAWLAAGVFILAEFRRENAFLRWLENRDPDWVEGCYDCALCPNRKDCMLMEEQ